MQPPPPKLLDQVRDRLRLKHYSLRTEEAYTYWIRGFIRFHDRRHPREMGKEAIEQFLSWLARERNVSASTQNQAKAALLFLYKEVLLIDLPWLDDVEQAKRPKKLPVVLTRDEVWRVLERLEGTHALIGKLLYGSGLRLLEACRLRVKDVDFAQRQLVVRDGKGMKDRVTMLAEELVGPLGQHLERVRALNDDLHARVEPRRTRGLEPAGPAGRLTNKNGGPKTAVFLFNTSKLGRAARHTPVPGQPCG